MCFVHLLVRVQQYDDLCCAVLMIPGTGIVFTTGITPNTCDYCCCCCFAATAADAGDGGFYWCCSILTAAAAPRAPVAALYC